jgi:hypothetical protein
VRKASKIAVKSVARDGLVLGAAAAELARDRGFGLLELRLQAGLLRVVEQGSAGYARERPTSDLHALSPKLDESRQVRQ